MPTDQDLKQVDAALKAAFLLIGDEKLQSELQDEGRSVGALARLGLPPASRGALLDIVNKLASQRSLSPGRDPDPHASPATVPQPPSDVRRILLESFVHIRWSFWMSMVMSVILFLVGLAFLGTALAHSLSAKDVSTSTLTVAGLGMADFVLLFYSRPWKDVAANLANSQQIRMIATSYLAGFALIRDSNAEQRKALEELTERSVRLVQKFVEDEPPTAGTGAPNAEKLASS
jgi:hypothetical protein